MRIQKSILVLSKKTQNLGISIKNTKFKYFFS